MKNKLIALVSMFLPVLFGSFANQVPQHVYPAAILPFAVKGEFDALYAEAARQEEGMDALLNTIPELCAELLESTACRNE